LNESGPTPTIRWELWRSGLEDAEYFFQLQGLLQAHTLPAKEAAEAREILASIDQVV
jgi:hypothetical protein